MYYTVLYYTVLYYTVLYSTVLYCTVLYSTVLYCFVLYSTVLYCIVLNSTLLYCTVLYNTAMVCNTCSLVGWFTDRGLLVMTSHVVPLDSICVEVVEDSETDFRTGRNLASSTIVRLGETRPSSM